MEVVLFHNAKAGDKDHSPRKLEKLLRSHGYKPRYFPLKKALQDKHTFKEALKHSKHLVVAGGDGSIRRVVTRLVGSKHVLVPLPIGTANNIARALGINGSLDEVVAGWKKPEYRKIDVGVAKGPWGKKYFIEAIGMGLIGRAIAIIDDIDAISGRAFSTKEDKMHRDLCVMAALAHEMPPTEAKLVLKGEKISDDYLLLEVLNINRAGPGLELADTADPSDGKLDLVWATAMERRKLSESIERCLSDSKFRPTLESQKITKVRLSVRKCELRLDDKVVLRSEDFGKWTKTKQVEIDIRIEPAAVEFMLPARPPTTGNSAEQKPTE
jgi:diacylglycerol kinase (ATP)